MLRGVSMDMAYASVSIEMNHHAQNGIPSTQNIPVAMDVAHPAHGAINIGQHDSHDDDPGRPPSLQYFLNQIGYAPVTVPLEVSRDSLSARASALLEPYHAHLSRQDEPSQRYGLRPRTRDHLSDFVTLSGRDSSGDYDPSVSEFSSRRPANSRKRRRETTDEGAGSRNSHSERARHGEEHTSNDEHSGNSGPFNEASQTKANEAGQTTRTISTRRPTTALRPSEPSSSRRELLEGNSMSVREMAERRLAREGISLEELRAARASGRLGRFQLHADDMWHADLTRAKEAQYERELHSFCPAYSFTPMTDEYRRKADARFRARKKFLAEGVARMIARPKPPSLAGPDHSPASGRRRASRPTRTSESQNRTKTSQSQNRTRNSESQNRTRDSESQSRTKVSGIQDGDSRAEMSSAASRVESGESTALQPHDLGEIQSSQEPGSGVEAGYGYHDSAASASGVWEF